jgi:hypothetical protein
MSVTGFRMLKKDSYWFGILIGILIPSVIFGFLYGLNLLTGVFSGSLITLSVNKLLFLSIALNIVPFRYFFVKENVEKTGKGILAITVVSIILVTLLSR